MMLVSSSRAPINLTDFKSSSTSESLIKLIKATIISYIYITKCSVLLNL